MLAAAAGTPEQGSGPHYNAVTQWKPRGGDQLRLPASPPVILAAASTPEQGNGPKTNAVLRRPTPRGDPRRRRLRAAEARRAGGGRRRQWWSCPCRPCCCSLFLSNGPKINAVLRRPTPPGGAGPREGSGGRGGVIHAIADSAPQRPGAPAEGAGGNGGDVHVAPAAATSS
uniref:Uncharacterized protein n=1 Tax=Oryza barthii TaxID=65489 RepID=A0A0D3GWU5_9ORYZ